MKQGYQKQHLKKKLMNNLEAKIEQITEKLTDDESNLF